MKASITFGLMTGFLLTGICLPAFASSQAPANNSAFIAAQKSQEAHTVAPYQAEVRQLQARAKESESVTMAPPSQLTKPDGHVMIFISSSMPTTSLVQWMQEAQKINASLILRGLVGDSMQKTENWSYPFIQKNQGQGGFQINPVLFTTYGITQVPAIVLVENSKPCLAGMSCLPPAFDVVYGNAGLSAALQVMAEQGSDAALAHSFLQLLQRKKP